MDFEIPLYARDGSLKGVASLDEIDFLWASEWSWGMTNSGYAQNRTVMHRKVLGLEPGNRRWVDHINGDRLDNRRENLRLIHPSESNQNRRSWGASSFRGVYFDERRGPWVPGTGKREGRWIATVTTGGKRQHLGYFDTEEEAGAVAAAFRREHMPFAVER